VFGLPALALAALRASVLGRGERITRKIASTVPPQRL